VTPRRKRSLVNETEETVPLTQELGRFVASLTFERLPAGAVGIARTGIIDTVATMIAGAHDPAPQLLRRGLAPAPGPASLYFSGEGAAAPEAAWINGTAGHALDYDDVGCRGHVSTVLLPAILAEAETLGAGGREMFAPMSLATRPGPSWPAATPAITT
jgi:2-methylcitrate dehydratase PrpD